MSWLLLRNDATRFSMSSSYLSNYNIYSITGLSAFMCCTTPVNRIESSRSVSILLSAFTKVDEIVYTFEKHLAKFVWSCFCSKFTLVFCYFYIDCFLFLYIICFSICRNILSDKPRSVASFKFESARQTRYWTARYKN